MGKRLNVVSHAIVLMSVGALVACAAPRPPSGAVRPSQDATSAAGPTSSTTVPTSSAPPREAASVQDACESPFHAYNLSSAPYAGPGPHFVTMAVVSADDDLEVGGIFVPREWSPRQADSYTVDADQIRLVACVSPVPSSSEFSAPELSCPFDEGSRSFPILEGRYEVRVREAATGRQVGSFTVPASASDEDSCPSAVLYSYRSTLLRGIDIDEYHRQLGAFVEATV